MQTESQHYTPAPVRRGLNPYAYLKDVLTQLPQMNIQQVPDILPAVWANRNRSKKHHSCQSYTISDFYDSGAWRDAYIQSYTVA